MNQAHPTTNTPATSEEVSQRQTAQTSSLAESADRAPLAGSADILSAGSAESIDFWRSWLWWFVPALVGLLLALWFVDPFIGDWDGMDYTILSLAGYPSSMALGRNDRR